MNYPYLAFHQYTRIIQVSNYIHLKNATLKLYLKKISIRVGYFVVAQKTKKKKCQLSVWKISIYIIDSHQKFLRTYIFGSIKSWKIYLKKIISYTKFSSLTHTHTNKKYIHNVFTLSYLKKKILRKLTIKATKNKCPPIIIYTRVTWLKQYTLTQFSFLIKITMYFQLGILSSLFFVFERLFLTPFVNKFSKKYSQFTFQQNNYTTHCFISLVLVWWWCCSNQQSRSTKKKKKTIP